MPDKKLTDSEITIKALKELLEVMLCEGNLQRTSTISHTINLINHLQAENERFQKSVDILKKEIGKREPRYDPSEEIEEILKKMVGEDSESKT